MKSLEIQSNIHNYEVLFENNFDFFQELIDIEKRVFIIDQNIYNLYTSLFETIDKGDIYLFDAIEEHKNLEQVTEIYRFLTQKNAKRNMTIVSIGGGITQDVTGFVASTLYRGVNWIFLPTTFLAQADSCIGSKTSLNFETYKNIIGGFYPPNKIYIQPEFLKTLTEKDFFSGVGEVIKFQLLKESYPKDFDSIVELVEDIKNDKNRLEAIHKTMDVKIEYINADEFDTGKRNLFNYGHCFGHALENSSHYAIPHGIAVNIGMIYADIVALNRGLISQERYEFLNNELFLPNIFMDLKQIHFDKEILLESMKNDKKRVGKDLTIVIPIDDEIRAEKVDDLIEEEFFKALDMLLVVLKDYGKFK